ncbi:uncharacterized protein KGF55_005462 [Candida pseudojiufengensis]|uniref:uncharacterized protein n=1 Tax=Candida pseudojiufengensis TaxID=497109 RepID=UPI002224B8BE|nr:uncharacterized protein KGF55_005462 [Candida pseudojiufengensis]KAI5959312.1 hypothetical protein KGF55_005462 [Candida pseudojiufengensis]
MEFHNLRTHPGFSSSTYVLTKSSLMSLEEFKQKSEESTDVSIYHRNFETGEGKFLLSDAFIKAYINQEVLQVESAQKNLTYIIVPTLEVIGRQSLLIDGPRQHQRKEFELNDVGSLSLMNSTTINRDLPLRVQTIMTKNAPSSTGSGQFRPFEVLNVGVDDQKSVLMLMGSCYYNALVLRGKLLCEFNTDFVLDLLRSLKYRFNTKISKNGVTHFHITQSNFLGVFRIFFNIDKPNYCPTRSSIFDKQD